EERDRAVAAQPGFQILHPDTDVLAQTGFGDRLAWTEIEQVFRAYHHVVTLALDLIRLRHFRVKSIERELHHTGMRDPGTIVSVVRFALLVRAHFGKRLFVCGRIVFHRNLSRHSAHRENLSAVTRLDAEERI